jgi:L-ribulose-5-phosphate 3-epimerase
MADRRTFLKLLAATAGAAAHSRPALAWQAAAPPAAGGATVIHKSTLISMLPGKMSYAERFALARDVGFEAIEMQTINKEEEAAEIRDASKKAGLRIHSVMNSDHWRFPMSSSDPEVVTSSVKGMETSFRNAALWGADTVLLVPAVVDASTSLLYTTPSPRDKRQTRFAAWWC